MKKYIISALYISPEFLILGTAIIMNGIINHIISSVIFTTTTTTP